MSLSGLIVDRIHREGPVSFFDFMEMALYHPGLGYYTSNSDRIGRTGDFYTSPWFTTLFGDLLARQLEEMWLLAGKPPFTIVEYGAGTGLLCRDLLKRLQENKEMYQELTYIIIERSPSMREAEKLILPEKVSWLDDLDDLPPFTGCILSNELVDNFSIHQVVMEEELMEIFVDYTDGEFKECLVPASGALRDYLKELKITLPYGFRTEINLQAIGWLRTIASALQKGFVLTIDYGHPSHLLYDHRRSSGTLTCFYRHTVNHCPYINIGQQDITTHVNFSALDHWGRNNGLESCGYTNQAFFLQGLGLAGRLKDLEEEGRLNTDDPAQKLLLIRNFLMDMGRQFKVLIQQKGFRRPFLSGLRFAQPLP